MSIELQQSEDRSVVRLAEPITLGCAAELHQLLVEAISSNRSVAIDLEGVTELDVSAIQLLYAARQAAERAGISLSVQGILPEVVKNAFLEAGVDPYGFASGAEVQ